MADSLLVSLIGLVAGVALFISLAEILGFEVLTMIWPLIRRWGEFRFGVTAVWVETLVALGLLWIERRIASIPAQDQISVLGLVSFVAHLALALACALLCRQASDKPKEAS